MKKQLKIQNPENCTGCELCVMECQQQNKRVGMEQSLIRILREKVEGKEYPLFHPHLDPQIQNLDVNAIKNICPMMVFEVSEEESDGFEN